MIFLDTDIFVIDLRYKNDPKYETNRLFLEKVRANKPTTSIFNILEACGILSHNLNKKQLYELFLYMPRKYNLIINNSNDLSQTLPSYPIGYILDIMTKKTSFGDSLISCYVNSSSDELSCFVSWNSSHFENRLSIPVLTPQDALNRIF